MLMMPVLQWHLMAAFVEPTPADAHDAGPAVAFPWWILPQLMLMMPVLLWHSMAALMEPTPADAHDAGPAAAFSGCLG